MFNYLIFTFLCKLITIHIIFFADIENENFVILILSGAATFKIHLLKDITWKRILS